MFPSELFSVSLLFPHILCDADLSKRFNILALDPRGHGLTREVPPRDDSPHLYDLDVKAADCMDFLTLFLESAPAGPPDGWKVHAVACGMSGLVATRAAAKMASSILSCVIVSPILEVEDQFIIDSITECEELINEAWALAHDPDGEKNKKAKLPNEIVGECVWAATGWLCSPWRSLLTLLPRIRRVWLPLDGRERAAAIPRRWRHVWRSLRALHPQARRQRGSQGLALQPLLQPRRPGGR